MYRCVKSPNQELHLLVKPESLSLENQDKLGTLIHKLIKQHLIHDQFNFGLVTTELKSQLSNFLRLQDYT